MKEKSLNSQINWKILGFSNTHNSFRAMFREENQNIYICFSDPVIISTPFRVDGNIVRKLLFEVVRNVINWRMFLSVRVLRAVHFSRLILLKVLRLWGFCYLIHFCDSVGSKKNGTRFRLHSPEDNFSYWAVSSIQQLSGLRPYFVETPVPVRSPKLSNIEPIS